MIALNLRMVAEQLGLDLDRFHEELVDVLHASHDTLDESNSEARNG
ncbi:MULTISPECIES: hypothetical protein [Paenibacillus]|nr:hypothetical protein [Paenibacillus caseinilyticus]MCZ8521093.1 hypothetical protein [Paenibacillus caseinilyticus]